MKKKTIACYIEEDLLKDLRSIAQKQRRTISNLMSYALNEWVTKSKEQKDKPSNNQNNQSDKS